MKKYQIQVVMEQDEDGKYIASCPAFEEAMRNIKDVIKTKGGKL